MKIKSIRNIKIKIKLLVLGAISIGGMLLMGVESVITMSEINQANRNATDSWLPAIVDIEELHKSISDYRLLEHYHVIAVNDSDMREAEVELEKLRGEIATGLETYIAYTQGQPDEEMILKAESVWMEYLTCSEQLLEVSKRNETAQALELLQGDSKQLFSQAGVLFSEILEYNKTGVQEAAERAKRLYTITIELKIITLLLAGILITAIIVYIIRSIEKPVEEIVDGTGRVSNGDLSVHLDYRSEDEIGRATVSVNALIMRLNHIIKDEKYLLQEIGNKNYKAKSQCEWAYRGDFAPILYALTSLQSRLEQSDPKPKLPSVPKKQEKATAIEHIQAGKPKGIK